MSLSKIVAQGLSNTSVVSGVYTEPTLTIDPQGRILLASNNFTSQAAFNQANTANTRAYSTVLKSGDTMTGALNINSPLVGTTWGNGALNVYGNIVGNSAVYFGGTAAFGTANGSNKFSNALISAIGNSTSYSQIVLQNGNSGVGSSTDVVATADNGTDIDTFIDMGINSSSYNQAGFELTGPNDGYLYVYGNTATGGGNLVLSTFTPKDIVFSLGGQGVGNEYARFKYNTGLVLKNLPLTFADGTSQNTAAGSITYSKYTSNITATAGQAIIADTSSGTFTVTLPSSPSTGTQVVVVDGNNFTANNLTVARNGSTIESIAEDLILDIQGVSVTFIYDGTTWEIFTQVGAQGGTANNFGIISVAGQSNVVASTLGAPVTFVAGTNATITTDAVNKTITFNSLVPTTNYLIKTSGYTATSGDKVFCDTTSSAFTITLPASPSAGNYVTVSSGPYVAINKLTIGRNGSTIMGLSEDMDITVNNTSIDFVYDGSTWRIA